MASPQGLNLAIALLLCFLLTAIAMILESLFHVSRDIVYPAVIVAYIVVIAIAMFRISRVNKRAAEKRKKIYREKFGREES